MNLSNDFLYSHYISVWSTRVKGQKQANSFLKKSGGMLCSFSYMCYEAFLKKIARKNAKKKMGQNKTGRGKTAMLIGVNQLQEWLQEWLPRNVFGQPLQEYLTQLFKRTTQATGGVIAFQWRCLAIREVKASISLCR